MLGAWCGEQGAPGTLGDRIYKIEDRSKKGSGERGYLTAAQRARRWVKIKLILMNLSF